MSSEIITLRQEVARLQEEIAALRSQAAEQRLQEERESADRAVRADADLRQIMAGARCLLWYGTVEELEDGRLDWRLQPIDPEASERYLPLDLPPGYTYSDACIPEDKKRIEAF